MLSNICSVMNMITNAIATCEAVARNILKGFYFIKINVLGYKDAGLYCTQAKIPVCGLS